MMLQVIDQDLTVCKLPQGSPVDLSLPFVFVGKTDHELSVVLPTASVPSVTLAREDGWRAFRFAGTLDFSLIGILSAVASLLADHGISIFAVSTYDTDTILIRKERFHEAMDILRAGGYTIESI